MYYEKLARILEVVSVKQCLVYDTEATANDQNRSKLKKPRPNPFTLWDTRRDQGENEANYNK